MTTPAAPNDPASPNAPSAAPSLVTLTGVVARDAAGRRGAARGALQSVTAHLGPGVHAFLGAPEDGTIALCEVIAGVRPPLRGQVLVHGESPWSSPAIRASIGSLLAAPEIPGARTVRAAVLQAILALHRAPAEADMVLPALGIGALAERPPKSLSYAEARAVELALAFHVARAVTMRAAPPVLVLHEPCADLALPSTRAVDDAIAAQREAGACVIVATSSPADARRLADTVWILHGGHLARREHGDGRGLALGDAEIAVWFAAVPTGPGAPVASAIRALASAVSDHPAVRAAYWEDPPPGSGRPPVLRVRGADRDACALAVLDAAASAHIAVEAITSASPDLGAVRSTSLAWRDRLRGGPKPPVRPVPSGPTGGSPASPVEPSGGSPLSNATSEHDRNEARLSNAPSGHDRNEARLSSATSEHDRNEARLSNATSANATGGPGTPQGSSST